MFDKANLPDCSRVAVGYEGGEVVGQSRCIFGRAYFEVAPQQEHPASGRVVLVP